MDNKLGGGVDVRRFAVADVGGIFIKGALIEEGGQVLERSFPATEKSGLWGSDVGKIKI